MLQGAGGLVAIALLILLFACFFFFCCIASLAIWLHFERNQFRRPWTAQPEYREYVSVIFESQLLPLTPHKTIMVICGAKFEKSQLWFAKDCTFIVWDGHLIFVNTGKLYYKQKTLLFNLKVPFVVVDHLQTPAKTTNSSMVVVVVTELSLGQTQKIFSVWCMRVNGKRLVLGQVNFGQSTHRRRRHRLVVARLPAIHKYTRPHKVRSSFVGPAASWTCRGW